MMDKPTIEINKIHLLEFAQAVALNPKMAMTTETLGGTIKTVDHDTCSICGGRVHWKHLQKDDGLGLTALEWHCEKCGKTTKALSAGVSAFVKRYEDATAEEGVTK